ncbi:MAG: Exodeoxyribonuclease III [Parcubacteria group bacterium GW2011_GWC2_39_14]|nr:MAG: Exodeoxyribonuclease III [Parcubacteria group bacterium GW2011_GWC2_39_14]KKR54848.1 MAG: Exodeoxyribonuclease III [Parcubacteria group bacterium GW2011_GWA2_40_23]
MKLSSWNVNGMRAVIKNGFTDYLDKHNPDIICLQEIKIDNEARAKESFDFTKYEEFWNPAQKKGYSGTAVLVKNKLTAEIIRYTEGIGEAKFDSEGRVQTLEFKKFFLVNVYFPNSRHDLSRLKYKVEFNNLLWAHLIKLEKKKPIVITGDFNVAHKEIDLKNPKENIHNAGFTIEERDSFDELIKKGFIDSFRYKYPDKVQYSWWSYRSGARRRNIGWRIDYFCISPKLKDKIKKAAILDDVVGSDHCPVILDLEI